MKVNTSEEQPSLLREKFQFNGSWRDGCQMWNLKSNKRPNKTAGTMVIATATIPGGIPDGRVLQIVEVDHGKFIITLDSTKGGGSCRKGGQ